MPSRLLRNLAPVLLLLAVAPASALAAPPPNDTPGTAAAFEPYTTSRGNPGDVQAIAELVEATPDSDAPRCLGSKSFARTVWYRIPSSLEQREITVEASGRTLAVPDLALYVQEDNSSITTRRPNACAGAGVRGADSAEDRAASVTIRVPVGKAVLVQVGRRGAVGSPDDERVVLSMTAPVLPGFFAPDGDRAGQATPRVPRSGRSVVGLRGSTITSEDPAVAACPSFSSVWRRVKPRRTQTLAIAVAGLEASSLAVFRGARPDAAGYLGCVDRGGNGPLVLPVHAVKNRTMWVRVGADRPPGGATATLDVAVARKGETSSDGACLGQPGTSIGGGLTPGSRKVKKRNRNRAIGIVFRVEDGPACDARVRLLGPRGRLYAAANVAALRGHGEIVALRRQRRLVRGVYRVQVEAAGLLGQRYRIPTKIRFRLT